jgi:hypothetical protein
MLKHCQQCDRDFHNPSSLKRHAIAKHTPIRHEHQCSSCDAKFARKDALQRHISSRHKRDLMEQCQFCLEPFRKDYSARHEPRCARKYWAKFCRSAELTKEIRDERSNEINRRPPVQRDKSPDAEPIPAVGNDLRIVHEIDIDPRLASRAFDFVFQHCWDTGDVDSCLEAIAISFRHSVPIKFRSLHPGGPFYYVSWLAIRVAACVRGDTGINEADFAGLTLMDRACSAGAASLVEPLFWRGAEFGDKSLVYAIRSGSFDTVHFCLALGADPDGFAIRQENMYDGKPLMRASVNPETTHIASLLVEYGATVFMKDAFGNTPLHLAAGRADVDFLRVLLAKDSSSEFLDFIDITGRRALEVAIGSINSGTDEDQVLEFVSALLDAGADTRGFSYRESALCRAVGDRWGAIVRLLLNREPESPRKTEYLNEALMEAFDDDSENVMRILIEAGATVNDDDDDMLAHALRYASSGGVELLLKAGARVDLVEDHTWELLVDAACDQRLSGRMVTGHEWSDAVAKYELLHLYLPHEFARLAQWD